MARLLASVALAFALVSPEAWAQSSPQFSYGQVPTAAQWNSIFASKQDVLTYTPLNRAGGTMTGRLATAPSTSNGTGFSLLPGFAPSTPANGDLWMTGSGLFAQIGGQTIPISNGAASVPTNRVVGTSGLATGGGNLSSDRTITVPKATSAMVSAGTDDTSAVTSLALALALAGKLNTTGGTLTGALGLPALNVTSASSTLNTGLILTQTPAGTINGSFQPNKILINLGPVNTGTGGSAFGFVEPFVVEQHFGGTGWSGGVNSLSVYAFRDQATPANNNNGNFVAGRFDSRALATDGGTNATGPLNFGGPTGLVWQGSGPKGAHFGINAQAGMDEDATNMFNITGAEFNVYSHVATAQLTTTSGSTSATYTGLSGKIGYGQVVANTTQVSAGTTLASVTPGANGSGSVTLSTAALTNATQAVQLRPSVYYKSVIQLTGRSDDAVNGSVVDAIVSMSGQGGARWANALLLGDQNGVAPLATTATVFGTRGAGTVANVIDFSGYTVTGSLLKGQKTNLIDGVLVLSAQNSAIELGNPTQSGLGIVDFHSSGDQSRDYDARISGSGGTAGADGSGTLNLIAAQIKIPTIPTTGGTVKGTVCIDTTGLLYVKTTTGACL